MTLNKVLSYLCNIFMIRMSRLHGRGRNVEGAPPDLNLGLAVFLRRLRLVEAGETAVVAFIQTPGLLCRQVFLACKKVDMNSRNKFLGSWKENEVAGLRIFSQ